MNALDRANEILRQAEMGLRALVAEAAANGDYEGVVSLVSRARAVTALVNSADTGSEQNPTQKRTGRIQNSKSLESRKGSARQSDARHRKQTRDYPRFYRQKDHLIKVAWSRREKKEYRHKASHSVLTAVANAVAEKGTEGRVFSTDEFLPLRIAGEDPGVPSYQAYVGISLLKQTGLIDQHGRQGYSIPKFSNLGNFKDSVEEVWKNLPEL